MPYLIHFMERIEGEDRWFHREDITSKTPADWLVARRVDETARAMAGEITTDHMILSAIEISHTEALALQLCTKDLVNARAARQGGRS